MAINSKDLQDNGTQFYPVTHIDAVIDGEGNTVGEILYGETLGTSDADVHQVNTDSTVETSSGTRLRLIYYVYPGYTVSASCSLGRGVTGAVYDTLSKALIAGSDYLQVIYNGYTESFPTTSISAEGYMQISLCKSDQTAFSAQEKADYLAATTITLKAGGIRGEVNNISGLTWLAIFTNGTFNANNTSKKIEVPEFRIFDKAGAHLIAAQNVSYNWGSNNRQWFALIVAPDYSGVQMIEWTEVNYQTKLLAFVTRQSYSVTVVNRFYGGAGELLFSIDA